MSSRASQETESPRLAALTELLRDAAKPPSELELKRGLLSLRARHRMTRSHRQKGVWWALVAAAALCCGVVLGVLFLFEGTAPSVQPVLVDKIEGGELLEGGYLSEHGDAGIKLAFNDGSRFELAAGTRGRLRDVSGNGARIAIERGQASFQIVQSQERQWAIEAGPFVVTVRGTAFGVSWDPTHEEFEVNLRRGRVAVSGPVVGDELLLRAGQILTVSLPRGETIIKESRGTKPHHSTTQDRVREARPAEPKGVPDGIDSESAPMVQRPTGAAAVGADGTSNPQAASGAPTPTTSPERSWKEAIATGQWDRVLADVDRDGLASLRTISSENLLALADAARYRRRADLARAALLEHRRRFPGSPRSLDALFLLGRVEEGQGAKRAAIQRYDEYLARARAGTYAAEAMGRRMILTKDVEGAQNAARVAEEYLRRFPQGSYAKAARALRQAR